MEYYSSLIKNIRTKRGLTQEELADLSGVSRHTVVNLESPDAANVKLESLSKVLDALAYKLVAVPKTGRVNESTSEDYQRASDAAVARYYSGKRSYGL